LEIRHRNSFKILFPGGVEVGALGNTVLPASTGQLQLLGMPAGSQAKGHCVSKLLYPAPVKMLQIRRRFTLSINGAMLEMHIFFPSSVPSQLTIEMERALTTPTPSLPFSCVRC